jgi:nucleoside-diphosphate kinase
MEQTLIIFKPDAVRRHLVSHLTKVWEKKSGFEIVSSRLLHATPSLMAAHYAEHAGKPYFEALVARMTNGPCVVMIVQGPGVVAWSRAILGATDPTKAEPWTIRGQYATLMSENVVHASDSADSAEREIALWKSLL